MKSFLRSTLFSVAPYSLPHSLLTQMPSHTPLSSTVEDCLPTSLKISQYGHYWNIFLWMAINSKGRTSFYFLNNYFLRVFYWMNWTFTVNVKLFNCVYFIWCEFIFYIFILFAFLVVKQIKHIAFSCVVKVSSESSSSMHFNFFSLSLNSRSPSLLSKNFWIIPSDPLGPSCQN